MIGSAFVNSYQWFEKALSLSNIHFDTLINYAEFLSEVRNEYDRAEQLYLSAIEHFPSSGKPFKITQLLISKITWTICSFLIEKKS